MFNLQVSGLRQSFHQLIPNCSIKEQYHSKQRLIQKYELPVQLQNNIYGVISREHLILLWVLIDPDLFGVLEITRTLPFTKSERKFIDYFKSTISGLLVNSSVRSDRLIGRIASWYSFETILVSTYLRHYKNSNFWTPAIIINQLLALTSERYENKSCFSGFIYASDAGIFIKDYNKDLYCFDKFDTNIMLDEYFFSKPASYRYVDGRNAFYLVDNWQRILGIVRINNPKRFSLLERVSNHHLLPLLDEKIRSRIWIGYVGANNDIKVIAGKSTILTWLKSHWHFIDTLLIKELLINNKVTIKIVDLLLDVMLCISNLRLGTLILIPNDVAHLPILVGKIDDSPLGDQLYSKMKGMNLEDLIDNNSFLGMLTSDGISIISNCGIILETGSILGLVKNDLQEQIRGGGRTQAAIEASKYGVAIKVSEDGPITFYINKIEKLKLVI